MDYCFLGDKLDSDMQEDENNDEKKKGKATTLLPATITRRHFGLYRQTRRAPQTVWSKGARIDLRTLDMLDHR